MKNKILFFDIDGTILDHDKNIPNGVDEALQKARDNGHEIVISTGRSPFTAKTVLDRLKIDSFVCYNGQIVQFRGKVLHKGILAEEELTRLTDFANARNQPLVYMDSDEMVSNFKDHPDVFDSIFTLKVDLPRYAEDFFLTNDIHQALIFCSFEEQKEYEEAFPNLKFVRWHRVSCDVLPKGVSKAKGMDLLLKHIGRGPEDAVAFGDGLNDIEMLQFAGTSVAMGNCVEELKEHATFVTDHVSESGLTNAMKKLSLI
ncbi:Cof-type HAD-IIB family hydrolase [Psychrobacillus sp. FSL K6-1415]|uniref:Cof-type HAD-IIB family hydrolase n=1 Tax=Psychrobacillus sp. FSL K6-1415 TaxID=2921544 RepID=UPI0030F4F16B